MALLINSKPLDDPTRTFVIAELSGNHAKDYGKAVKLVAAAAQAGADAVKAQTFEPADLAADIPFPYGHDPATDAWARGLGVARFPDLFTHGGLPRAWHLPLKKLAETLGLAFLSTPFSLDAAKFLVEEVGVPALKIASGDLTFGPLLEYANDTGLPLIVSTGGATEDECYDALVTHLREAWTEERLVFLHCVSAYPATADMLNLRCLQSLREELDVPVGFSDHTRNTGFVPAMAVAAGACCYEKHLRLDGDETSIDAGHSLVPAHFAMLVKVIREANEAMGNGVKRPHPQEMHDRLWARRSSTDWLRPTEAARAGAWE
jgi:sialic acid synthase SpsE